MNKFGGDWTEQKIEILVEYARAYLVIMHSQIADKDRKWKLAYFDGFAGSGLIIKESAKEEDAEERLAIVGAARRIVEIHEPRSFDLYYFVEKDYKNSVLLKSQTKDVFPNKRIAIATHDCNQKLLDLAEWLSRPVEDNSTYKVLAYIDPFGMQLEWTSLVGLAKHSIDLWILVPTGMAANRLLTKNLDRIRPGWMRRLEKFFGMPASEIEKLFYSDVKQGVLFGEEPGKQKLKNSVYKIADLYGDRLGILFKYISKKYVLKNSTGSPMFHYFMVSNNKVAVKIANGIIKKFSK